MYSPYIHISIPSILGKPSMLDNQNDPDWVPTQNLKMENMPQVSVVIPSRLKLNPNEWPYLWGQESWSPQRFRLPFSRPP